MSVINKVLRDLDQRTNAAGLPAAGTTGVRSIPRPASAAGAKRLTPTILWAGVAALGVVVALLAAWEWNQQNVPNETTRSAAVVAALQPVATSAPIAPKSAVEVDGLRWEDRISTNLALDALVAVPTSAKATAPVALEKLPTPAKPPTPVAPVSPAPVAATPVRASVPPPKLVQPNATATGNAVVQRQQLAAEEALASAQSLWNTGSRTTAMEVLQQAIDAAERASSPLLLTLVREMARMQLAEGHYGAVWELLTRLEPHLGSQADLWAIRANAAQRLGRHQDSVHAYLIALKTRPDEQRWLLGAAVSLAALGQSTSANEMAEKARAVGPINKDIAAYLRQAGVVFRD